MADAMRCPRCDQALEAGQFGDAAVHMGATCMGMLVHQRHLVPLLTDLSGELAGEIDFDHRIDPVPRAHATGPCPQCSTPMTSFGYMETALAFADRCGACWMIWAPPEPLGVMAVLWARTNARREARQRHRDDQIEGLEKRVQALLKNRWRSDFFANRIITGI